MDLGLPYLSLELAWMGLMLLVFVVDLVTGENRKEVLSVITLSGIALVLGLAWWMFPMRGMAFQGLYVLDDFAYCFKVALILVAAFTMLMAGEYLRKHPKSPAEFYLLILSAFLGMMFLVSAHDFVLLFLALELVAISFYVMTAYLKTDARSVEAGIKYLILGSLSSALILYGVSFLYGNVGSTNLGYIRGTLSRMEGYAPSLLLGVSLVLAGLGFKIGSVPFHLWIPDVYEGAPTPVTAILAVGSKMAGFAVLLRVFAAVMDPIEKNWMLLFAVLSALTLLYGNLGALPQTNIKRFLGYSGIGHAGYLLMGLAAGTPLGGTALAFYLLAYSVTALGAFLVVVFCSVHLGSDSMDAYDGLAERSPLLAASLFVSLLSLAGVPPLAGFFAKFLILSSVMERGLIWLALLGAVNVVISLYYYLVLVKRMYMHPASTQERVPVSVPFQLGLGVSLAGMLAMGIFQEPFVRIAQAAVANFF